MTGVGTPELAAAVIEEDPELEKPEHRNLGALLMDDDEAAGVVA